jgi:hypothetical protein
MKLSDFIYERCPTSVGVMIPYGIRLFISFITFLITEYGRGCTVHVF